MTKIAEGPLRLFELRVINTTRERYFMQTINAVDDNPKRLADRMIVNAGETRWIDYFGMDGLYMDTGLSVVMSHTLFGSAAFDFRQVAHAFFWGEPAAGHDQLENVQRALFQSLATTESLESLLRGDNPLYRATGVCIFVDRNGPTENPA